MSFFDQLFGKAGDQLPKEIRDKVEAAQGDMEAISTIILDELAENRGKKEQARRRLRDAEEDFFVLRKEYTQDVERGAMSDSKEARFQIELKAAEEQEQHAAEIVAIYRGNEQLYQNLLNSIELIRAQGSRRLTADAVDEIRDRMQKVNEEHRIKDLAGKELRLASEEIWRKGKPDTSSVEQLRSKYMIRPAAKDAPAKKRLEAE